MTDQRRSELEATAALLESAPEGFDQGRIYMPPISGGPRGCVASYLTAASERARALLDSEPDPEGTSGSVVLSATAALGLDHAPALFVGLWPEDWFASIGAPPPEDEIGRRPTAAEAAAVLRTIAKGDLEDALEPEWRLDGML